MRRAERVACGRCQRRARRAAAAALCSTVCQTEWLRGDSRAGDLLQADKDFFDLGDQAGKGRALLWIGRTVELGESKGWT